MSEGCGGTLEEQLNQLLSETVDLAKERARTEFDDVAESCNYRFVLVGAGNMGRRILARLRGEGIEPLAFTDNEQAQWGRAIDGLEVIPPEIASKHFGGNAAFIVTIYNCNHNFPNTRDQFKALGCDKVISVIPVRWKYSETFLPYFRDDLPEKVLMQADLIREAFMLLGDEPSRREFVAQVAWRLHGDFDILGTPDPAHQYFPKDIVQLTADEVVVDVGAYDGDTIRQFLKRSEAKFRRIVALEPDPWNFSKLVEFLDRLPEELADRIEPHALAASDVTCRRRFRDGEGLSATLDDQGLTEVNCVRLDDLLEGQHPTYIKMDIEGAEIDAIGGCMRVIAEESPVLAVCVYHAQDHLWKIPIAIHRINPKYALFIRPHMAECWDTVCYAVPPERMSPSA